MDHGVQLGIYSRVLGHFALKARNADTKHKVYTYYIYYINYKQVRTLKS